MPPGTRPIGGTYGLDALLAQAASRGVGSVGASLGQAAMGHGAGTTGMAAPQAPPQGLPGLPPRRTQASFVRPYDRRALEHLMSFADRLPPEFVAAEYERITGVTDQRFDAYKGRRQDQRQQLQAQRGLDEMLSGLPPGVAQAAQLSQLGLPAGVVESVFAQQGAGGAAPALDAEDSAAIMTTANTAVQTARAAGTPADFQAVFWGTGAAPGISQKLVSAGYTGADFEAAKELIRSEWARLGGMPDRPMAVPGPTAPVPSGVTRGPYPHRGGPYPYP